MRATWTTFLLGVCAAAGAYVALAGPVAAAKARPALEVSFAPTVVESRSAATAFLALRNTGGAVATLGLGDRIDVFYGTGTANTALAYTGSKLESSGLPAGIVQQDVTSGSTLLGVRLSITADSDDPVTIDAGSTLLVPFTFTAGEPGIAPVSLALSLAKTAGKYPKTLATSVGKSPPRSDDFFGDGSDGELRVRAGEVATPQLGSYTDVTIESDAKLVVAAGTTIRCSGFFDNRGTLEVLAGNPGGGERLDNPSGSIDVHKMFGGARFAPERGDGFRVPTFPTLMEGQDSSGALGGVGLGKRVEQLPLSHYRTGGGGGSAGIGGTGGDGGGLVRIIARGEIRNSGTILAAGAAPTASRTGTPGAGCGGGAGGIVILASAALVDSSGTIDVRGANGGGPDGLGGSGGGGGGGLVIFAAPLIGAWGSPQVGAGSGAVPVGTLISTIWTGGGGGGACVGDGGDGFGVSSTGVLNGILDANSQPVGARPAKEGRFLTFDLDPRMIW